MKVKQSRKDSRTTYGCRVTLLSEDETSIVLLDYARFTEARTS